MLGILVLVVVQIWGMYTIIGYLEPLGHVEVAVWARKETPCCLRLHIEEPVREDFPAKYAGPQQLEFAFEEESTTAM